MKWSTVLAVTNFFTRNLVHSRTIYDSEVREVLNIRRENVSQPNNNKVLQPCLLTMTRKNYALHFMLSVGRGMLPQLWHAVGHHPRQLETILLHKLLQRFW